MKRLYLHIFLATIAIAGCTGTTSVPVDSGKPNSAAPFNPGEAPAAAVDFEKDCGIAQDKISDKNAVVFSGTYTSFPIIVISSSSVPIVGSVDYRAILQAKTTISATSQKSDVTQQVNLFDFATPNGLFTMVGKGTAVSQAQKQCGTTSTTMLPIADWLTLTGDGPKGNPEFKGLLCAIAGSKGMTATTPEGVLSATFQPALISSVSPLASPERMRLEVGSGRTIHVTANVTSVFKTGGGGFPAAPVDTNFQVGQKQGTITIQEVAPVFSVVNADAGINSSIRGDIAFQVTNNFQCPTGHCAYSVGLPYRITYLIDTTRKAILAMQVEADRPDVQDPSSGRIVQPPVVLVKDH